MKVSKNFDIREFVPPAIWDSFGGASTWFIQKNMIEFAQFIRDRYGVAVTVNNWYYSPGGFSERGFRLPTSETGAKLSQHRLGNVLDFNVSGMPPDEVREDIVSSWSEFSKYITTIEDGAYAPTWVHVDNRNTRQSKILIVKP